MRIRHRLAIAGAFVGILLGLLTKRGHAQESWSSTEIPGRAVNLSTLTPTINVGCASVWLEFDSEPRLSRTQRLPGLSGGVRGSEDPDIFYYVIAVADGTSDHDAGLGWITTWSDSVTMTHEPGSSRLNAADPFAMTEMLRTVRGRFSVVLPMQSGDTRIEWNMDGAAEAIADVTGGRCR